MIVTIQTQDPDVVTAPRIAELIEAGGFFVEQVTVNGASSDQDTHDAAKAALATALDTAARAAYGDSNDDEIDALNDALGRALSILGMEKPYYDGDDEDESEDDQ